MKHSWLGKIDWMGVVMPACLIGALVIIILLGTLVFG